MLTLVFIAGDVAHIEELCLDQMRAAAAGARLTLFQKARGVLEVAAAHHAITQK
jgi:hypothetical protein